MKKAKRMDTKSPLDEYMTIAEAEDLLRSSRTQIYEWSRKGKLELVKFMGRTLVSQQSVQKLLSDEIKPFTPPDEKRR